jgi:hypothetical protein
MSVGAPVMQRAVRPALLAGPIACGCALVGAAAYVAIIDPTSPDAHLPTCPFYELTGLWCPGCGLTRATHAVLRGDVGAALGFNLLFPFFLGAIVVGWLAWVRAALGRSPIRWVTRIPPWSGFVIAAAFAVFSVLRNLTPFAALAP